MNNFVVGLFNGQRSHDGGVQMKKVLSGLVFVLIALFAASVQAATWHGITDENGLTWARLKIVNESASDSSWIVSNCRTAIASDQDAAETDASQDWSGLVAAGATAYVWVYGDSAGEISVASAGGTESGYNIDVATDAAGDGELVITVDADGAVTGDIVTSSYDLPSQVGTLPETNAGQE